MICDSCEERIAPGQNYFKFENERHCDKCFTKDVITHYYIGGEFVCTDDDGEEFGGFFGEEEPG